MSDPVPDVHKDATGPTDRLHLIAVIIDNWHNRTDETDDAVEADAKQRLQIIAEVATGTEERVKELWRWAFGEIVVADEDAITIEPGAE